MGTMGESVSDFQTSWLHEFYINCVRTAKTLLKISVRD